MQEQQVDGVDENEEIEADITQEQNSPSRNSYSCIYILCRSPQSINLAQSRCKHLVIPITRAVTVDTLNDQKPRLITMVASSHCALRSHG